MAEPHLVLNALEPRQAADVLRRACGAERWVAGMLERRPFASTAELLASASEEWQRATEPEYLEAFSQHPQIGEDLPALRERFGSTLDFTSREQAGVKGSSEETLLALRDMNVAYRRRFGFIFIICATGKTAAQMLEALRQRLDNERHAELAIAAAEQAKITRLRLEGLAA